MADAIVGHRPASASTRRPADPSRRCAVSTSTSATGEVAAVIGPSGLGQVHAAAARRRARPAVGRPARRPRPRPDRRAPIAELDEHRRDRVGVVEQHYRRALSPYLPAADAIALPLALRGVRRAGATARGSPSSSSASGSPDRGGAYRHELSGGEQQRVAFAVALATRPPLLLADEPTGELDGATAETILDVLRDLVRAEGTTCLIVTHDELVERIADRVIHVADGRAVAERIGPPGTPPGAGPRRAGLAGAAAARALDAARRRRSGPGTASDAVVLERAARHYGDGHDRDARAAADHAPRSGAAGSMS